MSRYPNARLHLVHLRTATRADHFLIASERPGFGVGARVQVQLPDGTWHSGVVDNRPSAAGYGPVMVTLDSTQVGE